MKHLLVIAGSILMLGTATPQSGQTGIFQFSKDIGNPALEGSATWNSADQSYTLKGSGYNIWFNRDEFRYLYNWIT